MLRVNNEDTTVLYEAIDMFDFILLVSKLAFMCDMKWL